MAFLVPPAFPATHSPHQILPIPIIFLSSNHHFSITRRRLVTVASVYRRKSLATGTSSPPSRFPPNAFLSCIHSPQPSLFQLHQRHLSHTPSPSPRHQRRTSLCPTCTQRHDRDHRHPQQQHQQHHHQQQQQQQQHLPINNINNSQLALDHARETTAIDREIAALALPALGALALDPILSLVDTAFVGRLGSPAPIAGLSIASIVLTISFSIFSFLAVATTPLVARAIRKPSSSSNPPLQQQQQQQDGPTTSRKPPSETSPANPDAVTNPPPRAIDNAEGNALDLADGSRIISAGFFLAALIGLVTGSLIVAYAPAICAMLGASAAVLPHAVGYLRARAFVSPLVLVLYVGNGAFRGFKDTKTPFLIALVANIVNLALDPILIFYCGMGATGAAVATSVSQVVAFALTISSLMTGGMLQVKHLLRLPQASEVFPFLRAGLSLTVRSLSILGTVAYATATASTFGTASLAAFEITRQLFVLHAMVLDSIAGAAQAMISSLLAQGSILKARLVANRAVRQGTLFGAFLGVLTVALGPSLPGLFTSDKEVSFLAMSCLRVAALCTPLNGAVFALDGVFAAARDYSYIAMAIALAGLMAVVALTMIRFAGGGVVAVWGGLNVLMLARAAVLTYRHFSPAGPLSITRKQTA